MTTSRDDHTTDSVGPGAWGAGIGPMPTSWDLEADVVIIGAGATGLPAAIKAADEGASVIVVEANYDVGGHAIVSGGNVPLGGGTGGERAQVPSLPGLGILLPGIEPVLAGRELANHEPSTLRSAQTRGDPKHQQHQHPNGQNQGDDREAQHQPHPPETRLLKPDGLFLVPQRVAVALGMVPL